MSAKVVMKKLKGQTPKPRFNEPLIFREFSSSTVVNPIPSLVPHLIFLLQSWIFVNLFVTSPEIHKTEIFFFCY